MVEMLVYSCRPTVRSFSSPIILIIVHHSDKTIKLWKVYEKKERKLSLSLKNLDLDNNNGGVVRTLSAANGTTGSPHALSKKVFSNAHAYNINSISMCSDGELFISADDLRINLWNLLNNNECFS